MHILLVQPLLLLSRIESDLVQRIAESDVAAGLSEHPRVLLAGMALEDAIHLL